MVKTIGNMKTSNSIQKNIANVAICLIVDGYLQKHKQQKFQKRALSLLSGKAAELQ